MRLIYCEKCDDYVHFEYNNNSYYNCKNCGSLLGFNRDTAERLGKVIRSAEFCFRWGKDCGYIEPVDTIEEGE